ncbi:MAG TPA: malto-oligosyltrehalose trehalohydrolase [Chryseosolibacter sp.]
MSFIDSINFCGATFGVDGRCTFRVWAPLKKKMMLHFPEVPMDIGMLKSDDGYFTATAGEVQADMKYFFVPDDGQKIPDPASAYQPDGVHGPSQVIVHSAFKWTDASWKGLPLKELVLYELHVGTFTPAGTFEAIIPRLEELSEIGINAIELMPVAQFPGNRNWGYDGVFPFAVQNSYGGPGGLKKFVNACHQQGIAVIVDVVYNHIGPEGNYFKEFAPYFTKKYVTPWGDAINFDDAWCDGVREYFRNNALYWFHHYHVDGLRLDATHMIFDNCAVHFCQYLNDEVRKFQEYVARPLCLIAESDLNSPRVVNPPAIGGYGFSGQWLDDFHHALYVMLDAGARERYIDFGSMEQLAKAYKEGFVHSGEYVHFRKRRHGSSSSGIPGDQFVAFTCNHDQVGNRPDGQRPGAFLNFERMRLAAAALILSPYIPMLFMGEEYGEQSPFYYFISHSDPQLVEAVRKGRKQEFSEYRGSGKSPDPQREDTFEKSKLRWEARTNARCSALLLWYKKLISLRNEIPALKNFYKNDMAVHVIMESALAIHRSEPGGRGRVWYVLNFNEKDIDYTVPANASGWQKVIASRETGPVMGEQAVASLPAKLMAGSVVRIPPLALCFYKSAS